MNQLSYLENSEDEVRELINNSKSEIRDELYKKFREERNTLKQIQLERKEQKYAEHDRRLKVY